MVKMIDNYTLLQVIGEGNYGKVYRAKNIKTNQQYAIKIIPSDKLHQNPKLQQCTMNEVQTLTTIGQTDHIIMYYEMLKTKNNYYFVYEFCNGGTLMEMLAKQHHFEENRALDIFKQLLDAFKVLNRLNIMHRDLKPQNIFFSEGKVKLGDFGFCKGLRPQENLTKTMLGSPIYMAPQVLKGEAYSTKADIWSLGVILYEMLYGVCPFQSSSIAMLINTINLQQITLPKNIKVSQKTQQLLKKLLTKDYFRRIGWIQLFNWFGEEEGQQKENVFKASSVNRSILEKKASLVEEWAHKNKLSEINVKQRSVSQDVAKKDKGKFELGSLDNISPSNFQQRTTPFTPKLGEQNKTGQTIESVNKDHQSDYKSFSVIHEPMGSTSPFQAYRKPSSLPKREIGVSQQSVYGHTSCYKPDSSKKIFYSQNYQNIFTTPITQKTPKMNDKSIQVTDKQANDMQDSTNCQVNLSPNVSPKPRANERMSMTKNSLINSRANGSIMASTLGTKNLKQLKSQNSKLKRKELLQVHEQCLAVLRETYRKLQQRKEKYLKVAYIVMTVVLQKLKDITRYINIVEIDLLDISSLINFEIIQVDKMVIDIKEQIENNHQNLPMNFNDIVDLIDDCQENRIIKDFVQRKITDSQNQVSPMQNKNNFIQNISIVNMLPSKPKQEEKEKLDSVIVVYNDEQPVNKFNKGQYYTTNQFAQYYKNLVENKEKNSSSKISMLS